MNTGPITFLRSTTAVTSIKGGVLAAVSVDGNAALVADADAAVAAVAGLRLMGYSVRESAAVAAVATVTLVHGATAAGGDIVAVEELAADSSVTRWFGPQGIACASGISIGIVAGEVDIYVYYLIAI